MLFMVRQRRLNASERVNTIGSRGVGPNGIFVDLRLDSTGCRLRHMSVFIGQPSGKPVEIYMGREGLEQLRHALDTAKEANGRKVISGEGIKAEVSLSEQQILHLDDVIRQVARGLELSQPVKAGIFAV